MSMSFHEQYNVNVGQWYDVISHEHGQVPWCDYYERVLILSDLVINAKFCVR